MNIKCKGSHAFRFSWRVRFAVEKVRVSARLAYVNSMSMHAEMINSPNPYFEIPMFEVQNQEERLISLDLREELETNT